MEASTTLAPRVALIKSKMAASQPFKFFFSLFWQICSAMSVNDLITFLEQTILKWRSNGHFEFE